jgi:hypothetical protein
MASTSTVADGAALAVKSPRVNIFAKPEAARGQTDPVRRQRRGVFDASAACRLTSEQASRAATAEAPATYRVAGEAKRRRFACLVAAAAVVAILAVAISAHLRGTSATARPQVPAARQARTSRASSEIGRRASRRGRHHRRKRRERHTRHRGSWPRHMRNPAGAAPQARAVPSAPPAVPARPRRTAPSLAAPTPSRVAPAGPPEFM